MTDLGTETFHLADWINDPANPVPCFIRGDAREVLAQFPDSCVDLCFTDPPYNRGKRYGDFGDNLPWDEYDARARAVIGEMIRVSRRGIAVFLPATLSGRWWQWIPDAEQVVIPKRAFGSNSGGWRQQYFVILTTARPLDNRYTRNLWEGIRLPGEGYYFHEDRPDHPGFTAQALIARAIHAFTLPGEIICDPMIGSGTAAVVAEALDRKWVGIDQCEQFLEIARTRVMSARAQAKLDL